MAKKEIITKVESESDSDDDDIGDIILQSVKDVNSSAPRSNFTNLHSSLTAAGSTKDLKLRSSAASTPWKGGMYINHYITVCTHHITLLLSSSSANQIDSAQSESSLYNPNVQLAPSLERSKAPAENNLGKGWFNIEVLTLWTHHSILGDIFPLFPLSFLTLLSCVSACHHD